MFGVRADWRTAALKPGAWYGTASERPSRFMTACRKKQETVAENCQRKTEAEEVDKIVATLGGGVVVGHHFYHTGQYPVRG